MSPERRDLWYQLWDWQGFPIYIRDSLFCSCSSQLRTTPNRCYLLIIASLKSTSLDAVWSWSVPQLYDTVYPISHLIFSTSTWNDPTHNLLHQTHPYTIWHTFLLTPTLFSSSELLSFRLTSGSCLCCVCGCGGYIKCNKFAGIHEIRWHIVAVRFQLYIHCTCSAISTLSQL